MRWYGYMCITLAWPNRPWGLNTAISEEVVEFTHYSLEREKKVLEEALESWLHTQKENVGAVSRG